MTDRTMTPELEIQVLKSEVKVLMDLIHNYERDSHHLHQVVNNTGVGIWEWNVQTGETVFNERWANIIGYTLDELQPVSIDTWLTYAHPEDLKLSEKALKKHWAGDSNCYIFESRMKHKDGRWIWVYDSGQTVEWDADGKPLRMIGTHLDITSQKLAQIQLGILNKQLTELSYLDPLTRIPNRRAFEERLQNEMHSARRGRYPLSVLMIDIDFFKQFNDAYGHQAGDDVLRQVAERIQSSLPRRTDFLARYGGEELVAILPHTTSAGASKVAGHIIEQFRQANIEHKQADVRYLTVSVGISSSSVALDELVAQADKALYAAKNNGRNRYEVHDPARDDEQKDLSDAG
ncbi:sensor domain-containing diguanylate cyclase [Thalassolituus sp. LLYu03]|uniref:sensor domain-containing diguanylate cyclase n=1 Tax=Thalassolituus sp. LLYu03 TaxID=3421656 RepID=UPI003D280938